MLKVGNISRADLFFYVNPTVLTRADKRDVLKTLNALGLMHRMNAQG